MNPSLTRQQKSTRLKISRDLYEIGDRKTRITKKSHLCKHCLKNKFLARDSTAHTFAECPLIEKAWKWIHEVSFRLCVDPYPDPTVPETWTKLSGFRAKHIDRRQPDERRWQVIHSIALQTLNTSYWNEAIHGRIRALSNIKSEFATRLRTHLNVEWKIALRKANKVELLAEADTQKDESHKYDFQDVWCFDANTIKIQGNAITVSEGALDPDFQCRLTNHEIRAKLFRNSPAKRKKPTARNTHRANNNNPT